MRVRVFVLLRREKHLVRACATYSSLSSLFFLERSARSQGEFVCTCVSGAGRRAGFHDILGICTVWWRCAVSILLPDILYFLNFFLREFAVVAALTDLCVIGWCANLKVLYKKSIFTNFYS